MCLGGHDLRMERLDHATIYLLIAGTYTPVCVLALPPEWGIPLLALVWAGALTGFTLKLATSNDRFRRALGALYVVLGWTALVALPVIVSNVSLGRAGADDRRRRQLHARRHHLLPPATRPVAAGLRLPRDLARVHRRRRRLPLRHDLASRHLKSRSLCRNACHSAIHAQRTEALMAPVCQMARRRIGPG